MSKIREFDLNIEKVLENWEVKHAIRELIANAFDEQTLTKTRDVQIKKDGEGRWHIRDFGRGLSYQHFTQNENQEKLEHPGVIGKFGVGLKDAFATFDRHGVKVEIESKHGVFRIKHAAKIGFEDITTLHVEILPARDAEFIGTDCRLEGCKDADMRGAKEFFLMFTEPRLVEQTNYGEIYDSGNEVPTIYVNGIKVAEEPNFLFSYNITKMTGALRKALNRERTNVGRVAYTERVKDILLEAESDEVGKMILDELKKLNSGEQKDELKWMDIQVKFIKLLDTSGKVVFVTADEFGSLSGRMREIVTGSGREIVYIPRNTMEKLQNEDIVITDVGEVGKEYSESFRYSFVLPDDLDDDERENYALCSDVVGYIFPDYTGEIMISETLRTMDDSTRGVCEADGKIVILRSVLRRRADFLGVLAHELVHARSGTQDCSREFENELTDCIGMLLDKVC